jgi:hypothetical protein
MATITSTGAWTPLNVDFTKMAKVNPANANVPMPNTMHADMMQLEQLKQQDLPELNQFIQAMADGYVITFNAALTLLNAIWTARMGRENPTVSRVFAA